ncbi:MAG: ECF transporter S component [Ruminococcaceae bacterium]|nr:ECF transporter S component [Oscillospiraceae bacterium]
MNKSRIRRLTTAAILGVIAFLLLAVNFSIPVISVFAEFDLSALPEIIGGFVLGPIGAIEIIVVKIVLKLLFQGTSSMFTGEVQNLILSMAYVLPAVIYYRKHRTKKGAVTGLIIGTVFTVVLSVFTNIYLIFPAFMYLYGMDWDSIIAMATAVNPYITSLPTFVALSVLPFNIIARTIISILAVLLYKKISVPLKKFIQ